MINELININHYATYYFANIISGILSDQFSYSRNLGENYEEGRIVSLVMPFDRPSAYHKFIFFVIESVIDEAVAKADINKIRNYMERYNTMSEYDDIALLPVEKYLKEYDIKYTSFKNWLHNNGKNIKSADNDDIYEYTDNLYQTGAMELLINKIADGVFYITFNDRALLREFNFMASGFVRDVAKHDTLLDAQITKLFKRDGVLERVDIPEWAKRAVFFRDRGRCVMCDKDLSGTLSLYNEKNYDHIVPLAQGGINDVSNLQLLCKECNAKKQDKNSDTSTYYQNWF